MKWTPTMIEGFESIKDKPIENAFTNLAKKSGSKNNTENCIESSVICMDILLKVLEEEDDQEQIKDELLNVLESMSNDSNRTEASIIISEVLEK